MFTPDRELNEPNSPDQYIECDCGHTVLESDMLWQFGEDSDTSICDACNELESKAKAKPIVDDFFETLGQILNPNK